MGGYGSCATEGPRHHRQGSLHVSCFLSWEQIIGPYIYISQDSPRNVLFIVDTLMQVKCKMRTCKDQKSAIIKVLVDIILDMEGITVHEGLMYVLKEVNGYPVSGVG